MPPTHSKNCATNKYVGSSRLSCDCIEKTKKIKLSQGKYALVSESDFEFLNQWKWHYTLPKRNKAGYAQRIEWLKDSGGKYKGTRSPYETAKRNGGRPHK